MHDFVNSLTHLTHEHRYIIKKNTDILRRKKENTGIIKKENTYDTDQTDKN